MADLGRAALIVSLGLAVYATAVGAWAAWRGKRRLADSAGNAIVAGVMLGAAYLVYRRMAAARVAQRADDSTR